MSALVDSQCMIVGHTGAGKAILHNSLLVVRHGTGVQDHNIHDSSSNSKIGPMKIGGTPEFQVALPRDTDSDRDSVTSCDTDDSDKYLMVGQIYHSLKEKMITYVFEQIPEEVHVYEFDRMKEVLQEDCNKKGAVFKNKETEQSHAIQRWKDLKKKLNWDDQAESAYDYIERFQYGYTEKRLSAEMLEESLKCGTENGYFIKSDAEIFKKFIDMYKKL